MHTKSPNIDTRSLSFEIACVPNEKPLTSILTEDILDSVPIKPKTKPPEVKTKEGKDKGKKKKQKDKGSTITKTPTLPIEPPDIDGPEIDDGDGIIIDGGPATIVDTGEEGDVIYVPLNGTTTVIPTTERDGDIINTTITTEESQNPNDGTLQVHIKRI